jgi:hypothetical protein
MKKFLKEYRVELLGFLAAIAGIVLVVFEPGVLKNTFGEIFQFLWMIPTGISGLLSHFSSSDLLGLALAGGALVFIVWRLRIRLAQMPRWTAYQCPKCGRDIVRAHRTNADRVFIRFLLPGARRFRCSNQECQWTGLLRNWPQGTQRRRGSSQTG